MSFPFSTQQFSFKIYLVHEFSSVRECILSVLDTGKAGFSSLRELERKIFLDDTEFQKSDSLKLHVSSIF